MRFLIAFSCIAIHYCSIGQDGYYVTLQKDTIPVTVIIPKYFTGLENFSKLFKEVKVIHQSGERTLLKPGQISGFSFTHNRKVYYFETQQRARYQIFSYHVRKTSPAFLIRINSGKNASAFYWFENSTDEHALSVAEYYTLTRSIDENLLFIQNADNKRQIHAKLKSFYDFVPNVKKALRKKFNNQKKMAIGMHQFIEEINEN